MKQFSFYVPEEALEKVKTALFAVGAGHIGNYSHCCWQCLGEGQFLPQVGSHPHLGQVGSIAKVKEYKVEMLCADDCVQACIDALKAAHPYEVPAYHLLDIST